MSHQAALDKAGSLVLSRYEEWDHVAGKIPRWNEKVDGEVRKYIEAAKLLFVASLHWRLASLYLFSYFS